MVDKDIIWIKIKVGNYSLINYYDECISELKKHYPVQAKVQWKPAACTGLELAFELLINHPLAWLVSAALSGMAWDKIKILSGYFFKELKTLCEKNENAIYFETIRIEFDDLVLLFKGLEGYPVSLISQTINQLPKCIELLKRYGVRQIYTIELPFYQTAEKIFSNIPENVGAEIWWKIKYDTDEILYLNPVEGCFV